MSGLEVGGLVVGILPLLIEAVKSYSTISRGFRTFRHYSKEIKTFSVQLKVQNGIFLNEIRLLLRLIEEEDAVEEMLKSEDDHRWYSKRLNEKLRDRLQHGLELCQTIIKDTADIIKELKIEVRKYEDLLQDDYQVCARRYSSETPQLTPSHRMIPSKTSSNVCAVQRKSLSTRPNMSVV